eukprot:SAG22_NODE_11226_length_495_cov_0.393939_1_plen_56_part_10
MFAHIVSSSFAIMCVLLDRSSIPQLSTGAVVGLCFLPQKHEAALRAQVRVPIDAPC